MNVFLSSSGGAAIAVFDKNYVCMRIDECKFPDGVCVWVKRSVGGMLVVSLYCKPNEYVNDCLDYLDRDLRVADGKRVLIGMITAHLDTDFGSSPIKTHSAHELNEAIDLVESAVNSMEALNISMAQFGEHTLLYALVRRLSPILRKSWEWRVGSSQAYSTMNSLRDFLNRRA